MVGELKVAFISSFPVLTLLRRTFRMYASGIPIPLRNFKISLTPGLGPGEGFFKVGLRVCLDRSKIAEVKFPKINVSYID